MRAIGLAVLVSATLAVAIPARANADQVAYAWYRRTGSDGSFVDVSITALQKSDGRTKYVSVAIDRFNGALLDPVVESLRCEITGEEARGRVSFTRTRTRTPFFGVWTKVDISNGSIKCPDQHAPGVVRDIDLGASWAVFESAGVRNVNAGAYVRNGYVYATPSDLVMREDGTPEADVVSY
jgi:hypothetical protein